MSTFILLPRKIAQLLIRIYQRSVSPDHGWFKARYPYGYCRYYPSCSQYTYEAVGRHGVVKGAVLGAWRIMRCNPWAEPRVDNIPA